MLLAKSLRDLAPDELSNYGCSLFLTMGDERDFSYFLPRLLDVATAQDWWPSPQVLLDKLKLAQWDAWPNSRKQAVQRVIDLWFADTIAELESLAGQDQYVGGSQIDAMLCGIAHAGLPLTPYLAELARHEAALKACFDWHANSFFKRKRLGDGFWLDVRQAEAEVVAFYESSPIRKRLGF